MIPFEQRKTFSYMYARAFLRSNDYLGIQVRLTIIFILIIMLVSANPWITAALTVFTVFITGIQLLPLFGHFHHLSAGALPGQSESEAAKFLFADEIGINRAGAAVLCSVSLCRGSQRGAVCGCCFSRSDFCNHAFVYGRKIEKVRQAVINRVLKPQ